MIYPYYVPACYRQCTSMQDTGYRSCCARDSEIVEIDHAIETGQQFVIVGNPQQGGIIRRDQFRLW